MKSMQARMEEFIMEQYPAAILDRYSNTQWGEEYLFYPTPDAEDCYDCIVAKGGKLIILTEF